MTAAAPALAAVPTRGRRFAWAVGDTLTLTQRNLTVWARTPAYLVFTVVQPVMFVLLFRYVFGGAIHAPVPGGYVSYLVPGVIGQTVAFASIGTAIALALELQKGVIDRFRSMPMARSAVLSGRLVADGGRILVTTLVLIGVGYLVGFRFHGSAGGAVAMVALALAFGLVVCCVSAFIGLGIKDEESVQAFGMIWMFPLTFVSSAFVPIASMPGWMQAFANNQPVTHVVNALRAFALGLPLRDDLWLSAVWLVGILAVFAPLAVRAYRRASV